MHGGKTESRPLRVHDYAGEMGSASNVSKQVFDRTTREEDMLWTKIHNKAMGYSNICNCRS
jgi:hypothetical protein